MVDVKKIALFVGGVVFGSAGFKVLASKDAKKVYTQTTAAVLRMKDCTMETVNKVQEQAGDILADAALPRLLLRSSRMLLRHPTRRPRPDPFAAFEPPSGGSF